MATAALVLFPIDPVPQEADDDGESRYCSWNFLAEERWERLAGRLPVEERSQAQGAFSAGRTTTNFAALRHLEDRELRRSARAWVEETYRAWVEGGRVGPPPSNGPADFEAATGERSKIALPDLIYYRGGFRKLAKRALKVPGALGYLSNKAAADEFSLGEAGGTELIVFSEIARAYGGEHLALWTYGRAVHVWHASSQEPGATPAIARASFRLHHPQRSPRDGSGLARLRAALADGPLAPDWAALSAQLEADEIGVPAWFEAFGVVGARALVPPDREALWAAFERVALALLAGRRAETADVRALNRVLGDLDDEARLSSRPARRRGANARAVADAAHTLEEAVGPSQDTLWRARVEAASWYWDLSDGPAVERLTVGGDRAGFGASASLARLLPHFPTELLRDPPFLALAALEAEGANGHAFVEPLQALAEHAATAGLTLALYPPPLEGAFREAFGLHGGDERVEDDAWSGHAFVDLPGLVKGDAPEALAAWFAAQSADGHLLRAEPDGRWRAERYVGGAALATTLTPDPEALADAARTLDPRRALTAAGLPDLLEPGEWEPGSYDGSARRPERDPQRPLAETALARSQPPRDIASWGELVGPGRAELRYRGERASWEDGIVALRIAPAPVEPAYLERLARDLLGRDLIDDYGGAWAVEGAVHAYTRTSLDLRLLEDVVADAPRPLHLAIDVGGEERREVRLLAEG